MSVVYRNLGELENISELQKHVNYNWKEVNLIEYFILIITILTNKTL